MKRHGLSLKTWFSPVRKSTEINLKGISMAYLKAKGPD